MAGKESRIRRSSSSNGPVEEVARLGTGTVDTAISLSGQANLTVALRDCHSSQPWRSVPRVKKRHSEVQPLSALNRLGASAQQSYANRRARETRNKDSQRLCLIAAPS